MTSRGVNRVFNLVVSPKSVCIALKVRFQGDFQLTISKDAGFVGESQVLTPGKKNSENQLTVKDGHVDSTSQLRVAEIQFNVILWRKVI